MRDTIGSPSIDWWARFRKDKPIEKFIDYWEKMCDTSISFPSGIVTLTVRAFSPEDAKRIADAVVKQSENLINDLNDRMRNDTVLAAERDMQQAAQDLGQARIQMEFERNTEGLIDVGQTNTALTDLISATEGRSSQGAAGISDRAPLCIGGRAADAGLKFAHRRDAKPVGSAQRAADVANRAKGLGDSGPGAVGQDDEIRRTGPRRAHRGEALRVIAPRRSRPPV